MNKIWFRRKTYGWGWTPSSWEGWLVLIIWLIFFISLIKNIQPENIYTKTILIAIATGLLLFICLLRGEKPKWQWGNNNKKTTKNSLHD